MRGRTIVLVAMLMVPAAVAAATPAVDAASEWLATIDRGHYAESWTSAGALFRSHVAQPAWVDQVRLVRGPLGAVAVRRLVSEEATTSPPGVPDGSYEQLRFATDFFAKRDATETVVLAREPGGWRVDGYFIR